MKLALVIVDEDLPKRATESLRQGGYTVKSVADLRLCGTKDIDLWPIVQGLGAFFVTGDKEFGDIRKFPPGTHGGILLLRPEQEGPVQIAALLVGVIATYDLTTFVGSIVVATERRIRFRLPPSK